LINLRKLQVEISSTYDTEGNRLSMTNQDNGVTNYAYDVLNRVTSLTNPQGQITKYAYDPVGNILTQTDSNSTVTTRTYSKDNQVLTAKTTNSASHVLASANYVYDTAGLKTSITQDNGNVINYTYDAVHHLAGEVKNTASNTLVYSYAYTYDPLGNRLTMNTNLNGVALTYNYTYNNLNELTQSVPVASNGTQGAVTAYSYNNDGDLVKKVSAGQATAYAYDFDNRLTKITYPNATTSAFVYSADDRRLKTTEGVTVTNYLYDGQLPVIERNALNVTQNTYTNGLGYPGGIGGLISQAQGTTTSWYHYVHNGDGSVSSLSNAQGNLAEMYDYEGFGNIAAQSGTVTTNTRKFQTKELNTSSGLIYFGRRWYDPTVGRWTTADPLGMVDGPNEYLYVDGDPVNLEDSYGLYSSMDLLRDSSNFSAGFGDFITFGGTNWIRNKMGTNNVVNKCSGFYAAGEIAGGVAGLALGGEADAAEVADGTIEAEQTTESASSKTIWDPNGPQVQIGVDPNSPTIIPMQDMRSIDQSSLDYVNEWGDTTVTVNGKGEVQEGHARLQNARNTGRNVDVYRQ